MTRKSPARWLLAPSLVALGYACSAARFGGDETRGPTVTFPAHFAEGESTDGSAESVSSARAPARAGASASAFGQPAESRGRSTAERASLQRPPDPEPLQSVRHWEYWITYRAGEVQVTRVTERRFRRPVVTPRRLGRFAIELWIGHELVDRVRFDFPGLAAEAKPESGPRPIRESPTLGKALIASTKLLVPASQRATRAVLVDRATGGEQLLPWPPDAPLPAVTRPPTVDAGDASPPADVLDASTEAAD